MTAGTDGGDHRLRMPVWITELGMRGSRGLLAWQALVSSVGIFLSSSIFALYLVGPVALDDRTAALVLVGVSLLTVATSIPAGALIRRLGPRNFAIVSCLSRGLLLVILPLSDSAAWAIAVLLLFGACEAAAFSVYQLIIAESLGEGSRVRALAIRRTLGNVGFSAGGVLVGFVVGSGTPFAYSLAYVLSGAGLILSSIFLVMLRPRATTTEASSQQESEDTESQRTSKAVPLKDLRFVILIAAASIMATSMYLLTVGIPLWLVRRTEVPDWLLGALLVTNTVLVVLFQVRLSQRADAWNGARQLVIGAGFGFALAVGLLALTDNVSVPVAIVVFVLSTVIGAVAEMWDSAGWWTLAYGYPQPAMRPDYLAVFDIIGPISSILGPPLMMWVINAGSVGWLSYSVLFLFASALVYGAVKPR